LGEERDSVISVMERMLDGMVRKDLTKLRGVLSEDMMLGHMTGLCQRREEFLIGCGKCEKVCPQHLPIRNLLKDVAKRFES